MWGLNNLVPFNPNDPQFIWWQAWRDHIRCAKRMPEQAAGYCRAAVIAQAEYEMQRAIMMVQRYY